MLLRSLRTKCVRPVFGRVLSLTIPLDSLGDSITTAVLVKWAKKAGEGIKEDDVVAIVETDKVTMDIRAKQPGVFLKGFVSEGAEIAVGAALYELDEIATATASSSPVTTTASTPEATVAAPVQTESVSASPSSASASSASSPVSVAVPIMGESITTGVLAAWLKAAGDTVAADDVVASIETDKVTVEVRSPQPGTITKVFAPEGAEVNVGEPLFLLQPGEAPTAQAPSTEPSKEASTSVYKEATESKKAASAAKVQAAKTPSPSPAPAIGPATTSAAAATVGPRSETRVKMSRMRLRIAQRLKEAQNTAAMLTTFQEVDMSRLIEMRNTHKEQFEKTHGVKLGFMSAFVKASTAALQEIPAVNAFIDDSTNEIVYRNFVDVSVAVASATGLVVPVLRNTENMSFADVEKSIGAFGKRAKEGSLALEDMAGGTFTISNGGVFGSLLGTPILNPPQSAILGMHATKLRPVVVDGQVVARPMMYLALTYDHRLIDGREAVMFLKSVAAKIEDPARLLFVL